MKLLKLNWRHNRQGNDRFNYGCYLIKFSSDMTKLTIKVSKDSIKIKNLSNKMVDHDYNLDPHCPYPDNGATISVLLGKIYDQI